MAETAVATRIDEQAAAMMEKVVVDGDLSSLSPQDRLSYYRRVCESMGLNPYTKPFEYIKLNGKLTLYARRECAEQLRATRGISIVKQEHDRHGDLYVVRAYGQDKTGRQDVATGAVSISGLKGEALANAIMKAETKAKRRLTLSLAGLGWLDETEIETIPSAQAIDVDHETGEIKGPQVDGRACNGHANGTDTPPVTPAEMHAEIERAREIGWTDDEIKAAVQAARGKATLKGVTRAEWEQIVDSLNAVPPDDVPADPEEVAAE